MDIIKTLLSKHKELDFAIRDRQGKVFYSDWDCAHPFIEKYLYGISPAMSAESGINYYKFFEDAEEVSWGISKFHNNNEGLMYDNENILAGDGSTPLIYSYCMWLFGNHVKELFYVPPLYYNFYYFGKILGISMRPVASKHPFEDNFILKLPQQRCHLVLTDPVWYAGISVGKEIVDEIIDWQLKTGSIIFVDGSFQYCRWDGLQYEHSAHLNPDLTFRLICPTKILAIHGFRFSYLLMPNKYRNTVRYIYANSHGPTTVHNIRFAQKAMQIINSGEHNTNLTQFISDNYKKLISQNHIESDLKPDSGYFVFVKFLGKNNEHKQLLMDGDFFEQPRFANYARLNLLAPDTLKYLLNLHS